jgi:hypothetical protein
MSEGFESAGKGQSSKGSQPYYVACIGLNIRSDILKGKIEGRCLLIDISILILRVLGTRI